MEETTVYVDWLRGMQKAAEALAAKLEGTEHHEDADRLAEELAEKLDKATLRAFSEGVPSED